MVDNVYTMPTASPRSGLFRALNNPVALNAETTYGVDTSAANNYGLGGTYTSPLNSQLQSQGQAAAPSPWWIVLLLIAAEVIF